MTTLRTMAATIRLGSHSRGTLLELGVGGAAAALLLAHPRDVETAIHLVAGILLRTPGRSAGVRRTLTTAYLAERIHCRAWGGPVTGGGYHATAEGPAPSIVAGLLARPGMVGKGAVRLARSGGTVHVASAATAGMLGELSEAVEESIEAACRLLAGVPDAALAAWTRDNLPETARPGAIPTRTVLLAAGIDADQVEGILEDEDYHASFRRMLDRMGNLANHDVLVAV